MERLQTPTAAYIAYPSKIDHAVLPQEFMLGHGRKCAMLTTEEYASLLTVGNAHANSSAPVIPAAHSVPVDCAGLHGGPRRSAARDHAGTDPGYMPGISLADATLRLGIASVYCLLNSDRHSFRLFLQEAC